MPALGRIEGPVDQRDRRYPMALGLPPIAILPTYRYWTPWRAILDQDGVGACVGFAGAGWMGASPTRTPVTNQTGFDLYAACKAIDGYPGEGTWARVLLEVLRAQGRIANYLWAQSPTDLRQWVLLNGPVMVGTAWYDSMMQTDPQGFVRRQGSIIGGHEYLVTGYSRTKGAYRAVNSWGSGWGQKGRFWVTEDDLNALIWSDWGDAAGVVEQPVRPL